MEYFPGNVAAAHLVYRYLGTFLQEPGRKLPPANITDTCTSADGNLYSRVDLTVISLWQRVNVCF